MWGTYGILKKANTDHIKRAINGVSWKRSLANLDINDKVCLFKKTIKNILSNFLPRKTIKFDDRDPPLEKLLGQTFNQWKKMLYTKII